MRSAVLSALVCAALGFGGAQAHDVRPDRVATALAATVSILPEWPGLPQGGGPDIPPGTAPEGTGYAFDGAGHLVTALHVVDKAVAIDVRLPDGRILAAQLVGGDPATDIAVLKISEPLAPLPDAPLPAPGADACAVGNAFGMDLAVTCGTVSAVRRAGTGFNAIEDFIQTDAAMNPGSSGGPLIDAQGRALGQLSAIFAAQADTNIGVNFAVSARLVRRVAEDLIAFGAVQRAILGAGFAPLPREMRAATSGVSVRGVRPGGPAETAGLRRGDIIRSIAGRPVAKPQEAMAEIYLRRPGEVVDMLVRRDGNEVTVRIELDGLK